MIRSKSSVHTYILFSLVAFLLCFVASCASGGLMPIAFASIRGHGDIRATDDYVFGAGDLHGSAGMYVLGSGFPLTTDLDQASNQWFAITRVGSKFTTVHGTIDVDPIPARAVGMYRPNEFGVVFADLGFPNPKVETPATEPIPTP